MEGVNKLLVWCVSDLYALKKPCEIQDNWSKLLFKKHTVNLKKYLNSQTYMYINQQRLKAYIMVLLYTALDSYEYFFMKLCNLGFVELQFYNYLKDIFALL